MFAMALAMASALGMWARAIKFVRSPVVEDVHASQHDKDVRGGYSLTVAADRGRQLVLMSLNVWINRESDGDTKPRAS